MVTYHYVKFYVCIIIHLEVININVRNFNFPIGFYSNPHPHRHFQNGHHNTAKIQHCPISCKFDMWVDYDVPNLFPTLKNFYRSPFSKWPPQYRKNSTLSDFNDIAVLWWPFWKWRSVEIFQCREPFGKSLSTHISNFDDIGQCWIFTPHFYAVFWQPFWKWQTGGSKKVGVTIESYGKLEILYINVDNF
jgi:hypothetical protein